MSHPTRQHFLWNQLLNWLRSRRMSTKNLLMEPRERQGAGFGLYTTRPLPPSTALCTIPASALLNIITLSPYYPRSDPPLTAVQLISLHITLHRPKKANDAFSDPHFGPFISILPPDFTFHPLTWLWKQSHGLASANGQHLIDILPTSVLDSMNEIHSKFKADWKRVSDYLKDNQNLFQTEPIDEAQFLWGWLNVNTRCIYYPIRNARSDPDNISLCPLLDFANHTGKGPHMVVNYGSGDSLPRLGRANVTLVSPTSSVGENEEMYLVYGAHSNKRLFVEYGFVNQVSAEIVARDDVSGEVDVQKHMENLFRERGKAGGWIRKILTDEGYWGDWTMHSGPVPAHPSFRLITALRLYHAIPLTGEERLSESLLGAWKETILGTREIISEENEELWRRTLLRICEIVEAEAQRSMKRAQDCVYDGWEADAREKISQLWLEEVLVAQEVKKSVEGGIAF
ncbi:hypothetical protein JOM56_003549 [Amanita muscaria]